MINKPKILVVGPVCNLSGYSEHARTLLDSLLELQDTIEVYVQDTQWAATSRSSKYYEKYKNLIDKTNRLFASRQDAQGNININDLFTATYQVRPPNEFQPMSPHDIGVTAALETTFAPSEWVAKCNTMKHILVVSNHAKENLKNTKDENGVGISCPITVIPFGHDDTVEQIDIYKGMNIKTKFNFLTVLQMAPRKNFGMTLKWFIENFKDDEEVGLIVKTHMHNNSTMDFYATKQDIEATLQAIAPSRKCKVYFVHGSLTEQEMESLYNPDYIDCYITATHGEGFGIPIFRAACNGIPIIATNWSGHLDFLRAPSKNRAGNIKLKSHFIKVAYDLKPVEQQHLMPGLITESCIWAYPKEDSFKKSLNFIRRNKESFLEDSKNLSNYLREKNNLKVIKGMYKDFNNEELSPYLKTVQEYEDEVNSLLDDLI